MKSDYTASDFRFPNMFRTGYDVCEARALKRYLDGRKECEDYSEIFISLNDTVCATLKVGNGHSGCPVTVYRIGPDGKIEKTQIN
jgi:hypothetical protein